MLRLILLPLLLCSGLLIAQGTVVSVEAQTTVPANILRLALPIPVPYDVENYKLTYTTTDAFGQLDTATGLICVPAVDDLVLPLVVYNHGTVQTRDAVPSVEGVRERLLVQGLATSSFIALAPDYLGLGGSDGLHPYLHADTEASAGRDMVLAARQWLTDQAIPFNGQLFVTGYSQGGHAAMALHKNLETNPGDDGLTLTAAAHLSGVYRVAGPSPQLLAIRTAAPGQLGFFLWTLLSYNEVYGLYGELDNLFVEPYLGAVRGFVAEELSLFQLDDSIRNLLMTNDARLAQAFTPRFTTDVLDGDPALLAAYADNTVYDFTPTAPTLLYYCNGDEVVPPIGSLRAADTLRARGADSLLLEDGGAFNHGACAIPAAVRTVEFFSSLANVFPTSLGRPAERPEVRLFPNPVGPGAELRLVGLPSGELDYVLYDPTGRAITGGLTAADGSVRLPNTVRPGVHLLRIGLPEGRSLVRRVVVR